jgi:anti-sigma regulatory factor (Ser/Thr protein kinase)
MAGTDERRDLDGGAAATPPERVPLDQLFDGEGLYALRSAVAAHAAALGLGEHDVSDLVLIAHELATNAVRHGGATATDPGRLRLWAADGVVVCEVYDPGPAPPDLATVGLAPANPGASNGRGLWIIRRLTARLDITVGPDGTTITAAVPLGRSTVDSEA